MMASASYPQEPPKAEKLGAELRTIAEYACFDKFEERMRSDPTKHPAWRAATALDEARASADGAYRERNQCVGLIAKFALALGFKVGVARTAIEGWDEEWHGCVFIDLPIGQVSWHFHDRDMPLLSGLPDYDGVWDGHSTPEKYDRVNACVPVVAPSDDWQTIDTAPMDGTPVDLWACRDKSGIWERYTDCRWGRQIWGSEPIGEPRWLGLNDNYSTVTPSHWRYPPAPPQNGLPNLADATQKPPSTESPR